MAGAADGPAVLAGLLGAYAAAHQRLDVEDVRALLEEQASALELRVEKTEAFVAALERDGDPQELAGASQAPNSAGRMSGGGEGLTGTSDAAGLESAVEALREELCTLRDELAALELEDELLGQQESRFWAVQHQLSVAERAAEEQVASLTTRADQIARCRGLLKQTSVLNDAFSIWHDGAFGTICGLRLGRLPDVPVEWSEINAAWGQVALLLATLAREAHFSFSKYRIIPQGSVSKLAKVGSEKTTFDLFWSSGFFKTSFNNAMVCILFCVQELGEYAEKTDRTMSLPYPIEGDKVGGLSVRTGTHEVQWTRALKNLLTNLKWLIAWSTKRQRVR